MTHITVDDSLSARLGAAAGTVQLLSPSGVPLGHFVPMFRPDPKDNCPYSPEELAEMRSQEGGRPLSEIWNALGVQ